MNDTLAALESMVRVVFVLQLILTLVVSVVLIRQEHRASRATPANPAPAASSPASYTSHHVSAAEMDVDTYYGPRRVQMELQRQNNAECVQARRDVDSLVSALRDLHRLYFPVLNGFVPLDVLRTPRAAETLIAVEALLARFPERHPRSTANEPDDPALAAHFVPAEGYTTVGHRLPEPPLFNSNTGTPLDPIP